MTRVGVFPLAKVFSDLVSTGVQALPELRVELGIMFLHMAKQCS